MGKNTQMVPRDLLAMGKTTQRGSSFAVGRAGSLVLQMPRISRRAAESTLKSYSCRLQSVDIEQ